MERVERLRDNCFCSVEMQLWLQHLRSQRFLQKSAVRGIFCCITGDLVLRGAQDISLRSSRIIKTILQGGVGLLAP